MKRLLAVALIVVSAVLFGFQAQAAMRSWSGVSPT